MYLKIWLVKMESWLNILTLLFSHANFVHHWQKHKWITNPNVIIFYKICFQSTKRRWQSSTISTRFCPLRILELLVLNLRKFSWLIICKQLVPPQVAQLSSWPIIIFLFLFLETWCFCNRSLTHTQLLRMNSRC